MEQEKLNQTREQEKLNLTRGTKDIIKKAILSLPEDERNNRLEICSKVSEIIEEKYLGADLVKPIEEMTEAEYLEFEARESKLAHQSKRMGMDTSKKILEKVDNFFYKYAKMGR